MIPIGRTFVPFQRVVVPLIEDEIPQSALDLSRQVGGRLQLVSLVQVLEGGSLSTGAGRARDLRKKMDTLHEGFTSGGPHRVLVSYQPWQDFRKFLSNDPPDLLVLEWPQQLKWLGQSVEEILKNPPCKIAVVHGPFPERCTRILVPVRGGPNAELALRLAVALPKREVEALHLSPPEAATGVEAPFRGLERILPRLPGITFLNEASTDPIETVLKRAGQADLLVIGASGSGAAQSAFMDRVITSAPIPWVIMKTQRPAPTFWTGPEGERAGTQAISLLVDQWFAENTYHADEFDDIERLVHLKNQQGQTISLALPALNEEETVGQVISTIQEKLVKEAPLLDEIVLMDSDSSDSTRQIASNLGIPVHIHQQVLPAYGSRAGKGEGLWKSLMVTRGDIIVWIDTDIVNIHPRFVYGVIGPLLVNSRLQFVKGFYRRPLRTGEIIQAGGGGRVTELTARPLINLFYPELSGVIQPLSGEYGGRRQALEQMPFFSGYGVEIGLLIDIFEKFGLNAIAQVDLLERVHHNQSLEALSKMSFTILQAFIRKLERRFARPVLEEVNKSMKLIRFEEGSYYLEVQEVVERERPPMIELPEYRQRYGMADLHERAST